MEARRVFVDKLKMKNGMALLSGPLHKYVATVLRKTAGDRVDLIDGKGYLYRCTINAIRGKEVYLQVLDVVHNPQEKRPKVTLCVSPIKGPRMDWLVEKATELGVERIIPTVFKRTVIKIEDNEKQKIDRWKRIAVEASRQCGRFTVPDFAEPTPLREVSSCIGDTPNRWVLYERERENILPIVIKDQKEGEICVVIGPEGGIEESEIAFLRENGFTSASLGESILRAETAPLFVLSVLLYEYSKR